jgi:diguanylate cyclase
MLDLDHFKRLNDIGGHAAGADVLRAVADLAKRSVRESDLLCRYGGEELCAILPSCSLADARRSLEGVRAAIEDLSCPPLGRGAVTVSVGVAQWRPGDTPTDVLRRADEALYAAKRGGRNRVCVSDEMT